MLHHPPTWRNRLNRIANWIDTKRKSILKETDWEAMIQMKIQEACWIVRMLNDHKLLPDDIALQEVPLVSYRRIADEQPSMEFHKAHDFSNERDWSMRLINLVQKPIHNNYFALMTDDDEGLESILFSNEPRPPRDEDEELDRFISDRNPRQYLNRLDLDVFISLLHQVANDDTPGMEPFHLTTDNL